MRRRAKKWLILGSATLGATAVLGTVGIVGFKQEGKIISSWENIIDYKGVPVSANGARPLNVNPFSDMGAWHAYSLPTYQDKDVWGGFSGPLYIDKQAGKYLSRSFNIINISNADSNKVYRLDKVKEKDVHFKSMPGALFQEYVLDDFTLELELRFVTDKTALIQTHIKNTSKSKLHLNIAWTGRMFDDVTNVKIDSQLGIKAFDDQEDLPEWYNGISVDFANPKSPYQIGKWKEGVGQDDPDKFAVEDWKYQIQIDAKDQVATKISNDGRAYDMKIKNVIEIENGSSYDIFQTNSFTFTKNERGIWESEDNSGRAYAYNPNDRRKHYEVEGEYLKTKEILANDENALKAFKVSQDRWDGYIAKVIGNDTVINAPYQVGAIKAIQTLVTNWRGHAGFLAKQGITPSLSMDYFNGFWTWDSWKQAVAVANFNSELAEDNIRTLFDWQARQTKDFVDYYGSQLIANRDMGMLPDYIAFRKSETNWRDTKPPLSGWAIWSVYEKTGNINFLKEMYKKELAYHNWWYKNRDHDRNGILEYGGTVNAENNSVSAIQEAAGWESGLDNAPRFDLNGYGPNDKGIKVLENSNNGLLVGYSINQESVCLNSYAFAEKNFITNMARELLNHGVDYQEVVHPTSIEDGLKIDDLKNYYTEKDPVRIGLNLGKSFEEDIAQLQSDADYLKKYINERMFDDKTGFFYDKEIDTTATNNYGLPYVNRGMGSEGWIALWAKAATPENAKKVEANMLDRHKFNNKLPFPSASISNPKFSPNQYWRGPVWLDQAYFGVKAFDYYGDWTTAQHQAIKIMDNAEGFKEFGPTIRETYNPLTGAGQDSKNFSWSAGMLMMLYMDYVKW